MTDHKKLIAEAAEAILYTSRAMDEPGVDWPADRSDAEHIVSAVLAVFEKAHTPTGDEREAQRIAELDARQAAYRQDRTDWYVDHEHEPGIATNAFFRGWDAAVDGGFRRSEVPEPRQSGGSEFPTTDEVRDIWVDHMSLMPDDVPAMREVFDSWLGRTLKETGRESSAETVKTIPEAQGEPSDAQAERARIIADLREWSRPLGNSPEEETLRLVIERIECAAGVGGVQ